MLDISDTQIVVTLVEREVALVLQQHPMQDALAVVLQGVHQQVRATPHCPLITCATPPL